MNAINKILQETFGIESLRENQIEIVQKILEGHDVLALLPTGSGKSLTFQLPMLVNNKKTIVISPLIALMEDQVMQLKQKKIKACCIHSQLDDMDKQLLLSRIETYDFIYCSPEWLVTNGLNYLKHYRCEAIVIDEAHCISEWGYEFRPHYLMIDEIVSYYDAQVIALTATANDQVIYDIQHVIKRELTVMDYLTERENIFLSVVNTNDDADKLSLILETLKASAATVIYFSSKKQVEYVYRYLLEQGIMVERYHADMQYEERMSVQQRFMNDEIQVICATNAFGMGVNKSNIRTVIHYHMPKSIFQFIQEIGRGGRDGELSQSILLYSPNDEILPYRLNELNELTHTEIDLYFQGAALTEEKQELMNILSAKYNREEIIRKIRQHQYMKRTALTQMIEYINEKNCFTQKLNQSSLNKQNVRDLKSMEHDNILKCKSCAQCNEQVKISFEQQSYHVQKKFGKTLLNQLFNDLYVFT
ncbi:RecQ family ATP-dependent DNA helicase [Macrococcus epidermidis]|nr:RecQ family ATP-dependent DNA helicase [Macrococcus epidermidis]UTH15223.1 ATP-dependent DNA helicase RecQ [Macrococcus epidermidis]